MKKEKVSEKANLTDKDLAETLLLISETTKTLAMEVMLLPEENEIESKNKKEGEK